MFFDPAYQSLKSGLVGYWSPVATGPTGLQLLDLSGQNNHGTLNGMDAPTDWVDSPYGSVLDFDGSNDYTSTSISLNGQTQVGISLWYWKSSSSNSFYCGAGLGNSNGPRANIYFFGTTLYMTAESGAGPKYTQTSTVMNTGWMHIFYRYNGNEIAGLRLRPYLNGVAQNFGIVGTLATALGNVGNFEIGRTLGENQYGTGQVASAALWFRDLSEGEIQTLYKLGPKGFVNTKPNVAISKRKWWTGVKTPKSRPIIPTQRGIKSGPIFYDPKASWFRNGLVGHWCPNLTGPTGTQLLDLSGQNNNGTLTNMDASTDWVQTEKGLALDFDGSNDYVLTNTPSSSVLPLGFSSRTLSCWFLHNSGNTSAEFFGYGGNSSNGGRFALYTDAGNVIGVEVNGSGVTIPYTRTSSWRFLTATLNGQSNSLSNIAIYLDGLLGSATVSGTNTINTLNTGVTIGTISGAPTFYLFSGRIAECSLWNRALTASEIQQLYQRGPGGFAARKPYRNKLSYSPATKKIFKSRIDRKRSVSLVHPDHDNEWITNGLVGFWCPSLTGATGTQLLDLSGGNNNGVLTGMDAPTDWVESGGKRAIDFDGVDDYIALSGAYSSLSDFTFSCWINISSYPTSFGPIYSGSKSAGGFCVHVRQGYILVTDNFTYEHRATTGPAVNTWGHIVIQYPRNQGRFFLNGLPLSMQFGETVISTTLNFSNAENRIGRTNTVGNTTLYFSGMIDDVRIYNRVLNENQIQMLYAGGRGFGFSNRPSRSPTWMVEADETIGNRRRRIICGGKN